MRPETLSLLRNPYTGERLRLGNNALVGEESNQTFPIQEGIPNFISQKHLHGRSRWYRRFYDSIAFAYDQAVNFGDRLNFNSEGFIRKEYIGKLQINSGDKVLETALGTASNLLFLPPYGDYYGVDISWQMLKRAKNILYRRERTAELFQADGAYLPFKDHSFDVVFHMGGLQFYSDPYRGVNEMARVAKRGTTIHILDEERSVGGIMGRSLASSDPDTTRHSLSDLRRLVPSGMKNVQSNLLFDRDFFVLTFYKP
jgi:ubiquinone/menaquinone biosynthesis C-methylase UbiE